MSSSELKLNIHNLIDGISDNSVLKAVHTLLSKATATNTDWYDDLSNEAKASLEKGINDAEQGNFVPFEQIRSEVDKIINR